MIISGLPECFDKNYSVLFCLKVGSSLSNLCVLDVLMCDVRNKEIIERFPERYHSLIQDALIEYGENRNISYDANLAKDYAKYMVREIAIGKGI